MREDVRCCTLVAFLSFTSSRERRCFPKASVFLALLIAYYRRPKDVAVQ